MAELENIPTQGRHSTCRVNTACESQKAFENHVIYDRCGNYEVVAMMQLNNSTLPINPLERVIDRYLLVVTLHTPILEVAQQMGSDRLLATATMPDPCALVIEENLVVGSNLRRSKVSQSSRLRFGWFYP